jgi:aerobic-type carbon monoxide dehydrogenase small subunit (CoxS/CutS family)
VRITFELDGRQVTAEVPPGETLMDTLRQLGAASVKDGCANGDCGSCAVLVDGRAVTSCLLFAGQIDGRRVRTAESLADEDGLHPLQQALLDAGGVQCGFCTPGILVAAMDLLSRTAEPTDPEIRTALEGNLCRCTGYVKIVEGVREAAGRLAGNGAVTETAADPAPSGPNAEVHDG